MAQEPVLPADYAAAGMQWVLYRVLALAGAADSSLDTWDSDSDSDIEIRLGPSNKQDVSPATLHDVVSDLSLSRPVSVPPEHKRGRIPLRPEDPGITGSENLRGHRYLPSPPLPPQSLDRLYRQLG
ncbi:hypothetical protein N7499_008449 [Penicillium canescens]|nr:hypothetical protein N7499_008449 [Penicillium canescens]